jgi:hypothetical protein
MNLHLSAFTCNPRRPTELIANEAIVPWDASSFAIADNLSRKTGYIRARVFSNASPLQLGLGGILLLEIFEAR